MSKKIVMLCSDCFSTITLYNYISRFYHIEKVIVEKPMRGLTLAKRRIKKLGFLNVAGQILFSILVVPLLQIFSQKRIKQLKIYYKFDETPIPSGKKIYFSSVNDENCMQLLAEINPDIIIVNGTRILSKKMLEKIKAIFINMHAGITPKYRGVHGGYWAIVNNDASNCGVTVHLVDKGIDTGGILFQTSISVTRGDNFITYPYLQFGEGFPLMYTAIQDIINEQVHVLPSRTTESALWYHPTIWQYLYYRLFKGKK